MRSPLALLLAGLIPACHQPSSTGRDASSPFAVADSLRIMGNHTAALAHYARLRDSLKHAGDSAGWWQAELWLGAGHMWLGQGDSAAPALAQAWRLVRGDRRREAWTRVVTSVSLDLQGKYDSALVEATRARAMISTLSDPELDAAALDAEARIYAFTGRYHEMLALDSAAVARRRARGGLPRPFMARELTSLGLALYQLGRASEAVTYLEESLALSEQIGSDEATVRTLTALALTYQTNGHLDRASELLQRAIARAERAHPPQLARVAVAYNNLGWIYVTAGNGEAARPYLERALEISRTTGQPYAGVLARMNLGVVEFDKGDSARAEQLWRSALRTADSLEYNALKGDLLSKLAEFAAHRDPAQARRLLATAVSVAESTGFLAGEYDALRKQGSVLESLGDTAGAVAAYRQDVRLVESWRGRVAMGDLQIGIGEPRLEPYEGLVRLAVARGHQEEAFGIAERARATALLTLMGRREANPRPQSDDERRREHIRQEISSAVDPEAAERAIGAIADSVEMTEAAARRSDPASGAARYPAPLSLGEVQEALARPRRGVLVFFWGDRDVYGWWVAGDSVRGARLGRADSLEGPVSFLHRMVESPAPGGDWVPAARRVFDALVAPLTTADVDELLVVPDGPLAQIPFEVLVPDSGRQPLGARQRIIYGPSASVLVALARGRPQPVWKGTMLAVGDPAVRAVSQPDPFRDPRSPAPGPLPHAAAEARAVRDLFQQAGADLLLRNDATLDRWLAKDPGSYRYLHFAAHALVDTRRPEKTHVLLSGAELDLTAIRRLRLTAELVTLSACETGLGRRYRGEGVIGLPHAFLAAGARSVLVTLWRVEDEYAEKFMEEFYGQVASGTPPAAALETVRRRWIQAGGPESHPSHWAPFVLVGGLNSGEQ